MAIKNGNNCCADKNVFVVGRRSLFLVSAFLSSLYLPVSGEPRPCPEDATVVGYTNLSELNSDIAINSAGGTYVLCPNTVFDATAAAPSSGSSANGGGSGGLRINTANTTVKCGEDGSSSNDCVLLGGESGDVIVVGDNAQADNNITGVANIFLQGLTISSTERSSPTTRVYAGVHFEDCIWTNNELLGWAVWVASPGNEVTFSNCNFTENVGGSSIEAMKGAVNVVGCLFRCNAMSLPSAAPILLGLLYRENNVSLSLSNSCFLNNRYESGAVIVRDGALLTTKENFVKGTTGSPICHGAYFGNYLDITCVDFNGTSCAVAGGELDKSCPTQSPTEAPSAPAPAPSPGSGTTGCHGCPFCVVLSVSFFVAGTLFFLGL